MAREMHSTIASRSASVSNCGQADPHTQAGRHTPGEKIGNRSSTGRIDDSARRDVKACPFKSWQSCAGLAVQAHGVLAAECECPSAPHSTSTPSEDHVHPYPSEHALQSLCVQKAICLSTNNTRLKDVCRRTGHEAQEWLALSSLLICNRGQQGAIPTLCILAMHHHLRRPRL
eukprot:366528-Chlamydomonas_euryale.AAC.4